MSPAYPTSKVVCRCLGVTEDEVAEAIARGELQSVREVSRHTGAGTGCTVCHSAIRAYLSQRGLCNAAIVCESNEAPHDAALATF